VRPGPARGTSITSRVTVTGAMGDPVEGAGPDDLPRVYGVLATATDVARICRELIAPHLEVGELAVPARLEVVRRSTVPAGEEVELEATVQMISPSGVTCEVLVRWHDQVVVRASFEQEVVNADAFRGRTGGA
jgi:predicted thioesterase